MTKRIRTAWLAACGALLLAFAQPAIAQDESVSAEAMKEATDSVATDVQSEAAKATAERRRKIMEEAVDALANTKEALAALEENRIDDAVNALAITTGKLELIVARDPELALAPTDVSVVKHDLYATKGAIESAIDRAKKALKDDDIQEARRLLNGLGSELVINVTNLPLATYPDAIKAIAPLIDDGKIDEAKRSLQAALNTQVVTKHVVPLPVLRSEAMLERAEELAEKSDRTDEENEELANKLAAVREQLEMADLLGYGDAEEYDTLYAQLDDIANRTEGGKSGEGIFDKMKTSMSDLWASITS